jgi:hypothetical protein
VDYLQAFLVQYRYMKEITLVARLVMIGVGIVGVLLVIPAVTRLKESWELSREGVKTNAEVIGVGVRNFDQGGTSGKVSRRVYQWRFVDGNGLKQDIRSQYQYSEWFEAYNDDGTMPIIYDPRNLNLNRVDTVFNRWGRDGAVLLFFLPLIWLGLVSLLPESWVVAHRNFWEQIFTKK